MKAHIWPCQVRISTLIPPKPVPNCMRLQQEESVCTQVGWIRVHSKWLHHHDIYNHRLRRFWLECSPAEVVRLQSITSWEKHTKLRVDAGMGRDGKPVLLYIDLYEGSTSKGPHASGLISLRSEYPSRWEKTTKHRSTHLIKEGWGLLRVNPT